jgi:hypothetical protein
MAVEIYIFQRDLAKKPAFTKLMWKFLSITVRDEIFDVMRKTTFQASNVTLTNEKRL